MRNLPRITRPQTDASSLPLQIPASAAPPQASIAASPRIPLPTPRVASTKATTPQSRSSRPSASTVAPIPARSVAPFLIGTTSADAMPCQNTASQDLHTPTTDIFSPDYDPTLDPSQTQTAQSAKKHTAKICGIIIVLLLLTIGSVLFNQYRLRTSLASYSNANYGNTITEFIENTRSLEYEVYAQFDPLGLKLYTVTQLNPIQVEINDEAVHLANVISFNHSTSVHNHPIGDCPFSLSDLIIFTDNSNAREIVVSANYIYELTAPHGWPDATQTDYFIFLFLYDRDAAVKNGLLEYVEYLDGYKSTDALLELYADTFNLTYTVTPIEEWTLF